MVNNMDRLFMFIATGFYSGYLPKAPGTWGSVAGVLVWFCIYRLEAPIYWGIVAALFVAGTIAAGAAEKIVDRPDPGLITIDEVVGQLMVLAIIPASPIWVFIGFVIFRFFDILKPFPVNWLDKHIHGGLGIMLDDVAAGLYSMLVVWILLQFFPI
jgi:phosphatidylglycerophosphatase A